MPSITRTFTTTASPEAAYAYLADFRNAEAWDPGTRTCERTAGDGGPGTTYRNVSSFLGREVELTYTAAELVAPARVRLHGTNAGFEGDDVFDVRTSGAGAEVTYTAHMSFSGLSRLASPLVQAHLPVLARKTVDQLRDCLDRQPG
ncbi:carbon monoxide dehydrogenase subunit G [Nocardioides cavernae]|uniref:Carbon monoxide dehydrogenase subunit G n=1 Tax=Nocardioides cavernae TaxID=1921566 RepID=A0A7Y9H1L5_9ACTN|nr:SRPBCC family protein [Nocardioides cavernae]NYE36150.1 carbon monoxide dehydrogenase subunit G [Nocardioides cavernae]